jgi:(p)ppGpp synthase/HD superfamily hydrolase
MHYLSELGMSAHWIYKQREGAISDKDRGMWLQNIRTIMENLANNSDFLAKLQLDADAQMLVLKQAFSLQQTGSRKFLDRVHGSISM